MEIVGLGAIVWQFPPSKLKRQLQAPRSLYSIPQGV